MGTINPVKEIIEIAHQHNIPVLVDGAQSSVHLDIDVQDMDCDFFVFQAIKFMDQQALVYCMEKKNCWKKCRRTWAVVK